MRQSPDGQRPSWACGTCFDIGFVYTKADGREQVKPCRCRAGAEQSQRDPIEACCIPSQYKGFDLGNFRPRTCRIEAYEAALSYCARFPHEDADAGLGLLFWGAGGTGKTHLAVSVLKELVASKGVSGRFWGFKALLREIARSYDPRTYTTELEVLGSALDVDLLLLDDLASDKMTDWALDTLFYIINSRYSARRPTLITTQYEDVDRATALAADPQHAREYLIERIGNPTRSRLVEMCQIVPTQTQEQRDAERKSSPPTTLRGIRRLSDDE